jgi:hypothetical protein
MRLRTRNKTSYLKARLKMNDRCSSSFYLTPCDLILGYGDWRPRRWRHHGLWYYSLRNPVKYGSLAERRSSLTCRPWGLSRPLAGRRSSPSWPLMEQSSCPKWTSAGGWYWHIWPLTDGGLLVYLLLATRRTANQSNTARSRTMI